MGIDPINFSNWKNDIVTVKLFESLKDIRDGVERSMTDANLIMKPDGLRDLARLVGLREGLDIVLEMTIDDMIGDIDNGDVT